MNLPFLIFCAVIFTVICYRAMKDEQFYKEHSYIFMTGAASAVALMLWLFIIVRIITDISG